MIYPISIGGTSYFINAKPFGKSFCGSVDIDMSNSSGIKVVLLSSQPSAIKRTIRAIVINTVYCKMFLITFFHIFIKLFKRIFPRWANNNASAAIIFVCYMFFVITTRFYGTPNIINFSLGQIVSSKSLNGYVPIQTSATFTFAVDEVVADNNTAYSTITNTMKQKLSTLICSRNVMYSPSTKPFSNNVRRQYRSLVHTYSFHIERRHYNINIGGCQV
jgi:hypothetical protein